MAPPAASNLALTDTTTSLGLCIFSVNRERNMRKEEPRGESGMRVKGSVEEENDILKKYIH